MTPTAASTSACTALAPSRPDRLGRRALLGFLAPVMASAAIAAVTAFIVFAHLWTTTVNACGTDRSAPGDAVLALAGIGLALAAASFVTSIPLLVAAIFRRKLLEPALAMFMCSLGVLPFAIAATVAAFGRRPWFCF